MHNKIKHVFFDLDHTLWDFDKNSGLTFGKIFKLHNVEVVLADFLRVYEPINFKYWKLYREEKVTKPDLRYGRLKDAFSEIKMAISDDIINALSEDYINHLSSFNFVFDGTYTILDYLKPKYKLHIITNGFREAQSKKLKASKLEDYFITVTDSEMVGVKKPNPKIFHHALKIANAKPEESIMIGDSLEADVQGGFNVGMDVVHFDYANKKEKTNHKQISHLSELKHFL